MKFLEVNKLTIKFGDKTVVNNLSLDLAAGDRFGVIGESGSGKTMKGGIPGAQPVIFVERLPLAPVGRRAVGARRRRCPRP